MFDKIEKAHPDVLRLLLQILEDGKLSDAEGRTVDFRNTIVIMTTRVGARHIKTQYIGPRPGKYTAIALNQEYERIMEEVLRDKNEAASIGFAPGKSANLAAQQEYERIREKVLGELKNVFKLEFLKKIDASSVFHSLRQEEVRQIVDLMVYSLRRKLDDYQVELVVPDDSKDYMLTHWAFYSTFGLYSLSSLIQHSIIDPLLNGCSMDA